MSKRRSAAVRDELGLEALGGGTGGIGTPDQLREHLRKFADAGVDQTVFIQQGGNNLHENICEDLELFSKAVMPEFKEHEAERMRRKEEELAPYVEAAMQRKERAQEIRDGQVPAYEAYGFRIAEADVSNLPQDAQRRMAAMRRMREVIERYDAAEARQA